MRVMIVVTHLLGVGHLARAGALAEAFAEAGHETMLVNGGRAAALQLPQGGVTLRALPPVHAVGADFVNLRDEAGEAVTPKLLAERASMLATLVGDFAPEILITETFPFGRGALRPEFEAALEAAARLRPRPVLFASVRDILNPPSHVRKAVRAQDTIREHYDGVLVHGEAAAAPLSLSWPVGPGLEPLLHYTGYVTRQREAEPAGEGGGILVSAGGGTAGLPLFRAAIAAAAQMPGTAWRVLVGEAVLESAMTALAASAPANAIVERARADFRALLAQADLSISQAGYNTAIDLAFAGTRAVLVPFEEGGEREQALRAAGLAAAGRARVLPASSLTPEALVAVAREALAAPRPAPRPMAEGARRSVTVAAEAHARQGLAEAAFASLARRLDELALAGVTVEAWWRDDDAAADTAALQRLLDLRRRIGVPLALAASPGLVQPGLVAALEGEGDVSVLMHGLTHRNNAPAGARKQELGFSDPCDLLARLQRGLAAHRELFGPAAPAVLVPPWNRIDADIRAGLRSIGFVGLSTFGPRGTGVADGLALHNTHLDPVAWRDGKGLGDVPALLGRLLPLLGTGEPVGLLTHHLVHDGATWRFIERLLALLAHHPGVRFRAAPDLWSLA